MNSIKYIVGGVSISLEICPVLRDVLTNQKIPTEVTALLDMLQEADRFGMADDFLRCSTAFREEFGTYLEDGWIQRIESGFDEGFAEAMGEFAASNLDLETQKDLEDLSKRKK